MEQWIGSVHSKMAWQTHFFFIWRLSRLGKELFIYIFATIIETFLKIVIFPRSRYIADLHNSLEFLWLEKNITKTHAIDIHTLADGKFVINTCCLWRRNSQLAMMYDDVTVTKWCLIS